MQTGDPELVEPVDDGRGLTPGWSGFPGDIRPPAGPDSASRWAAPPRTTGGARDPNIANRNMKSVF